MADLEKKGLMANSSQKLNKPRKRSGAVYLDDSNPRQLVARIVVSYTKTITGADNIKKYLTRHNSKLKR